MHRSSAQAVIQTSTQRSVGLEEMLLASTVVNPDIRQCNFAVPDIRCGGCMQAVEKSLLSLEGVVSARVNLTQRRVTVQWQESSTPPDIAQLLSSIGYPAQLVASTAEAKDATLQYLLRALAVAAFASGNIMLLSVSVWSGADTPTNHLFHWVSAIIALPSIAYSGQVFFRSAWRAVQRRTTNMDVPISIGIFLALGLSCYSTLFKAEASSVYFEAPMMLVFFLLIGRTLDYLMRDKVRKAVDGLARLAPAGAWLISKHGGVDYTPLADIKIGDHLSIAEGEVVAVDCKITEGRSVLDSSLVTGESVPRLVQTGDSLLAGTRNLSAQLHATVTAKASESHLAKMIALMQSAELSRSRGRRLADRVSSLYAPVVHSAALLSCLGWFVATGDLHLSITIAIAVLIITCPCALGLAIPMVQVVIARKLFESGILLKDGAALERLAEIDIVVFDKTGTLTAGEPQLLNAEDIEDQNFRLAASMALSSSHPYSRALVSAFEAVESLKPMTEIAEIPGLGLQSQDSDCTYRLGKAEWAVSTETSGATAVGDNIQQSNTVLAVNGKAIAPFIFEDAPRTDASSTINELKGHGLVVECLSGDTKHAVARCAEQLGIDRFTAEVLPAEKVAYLESLAKKGHRVLMVGDGLNDAPALAAASVSMAPGAASDASRNAADMVFTKNKLSAVADAIALAQLANRSVRQNLGFALLYNAIALPIAIAGLVTPLIAALAMSASSVIVILNALRLNYRRTPTLLTPKNNKTDPQLVDENDTREVTPRSQQHA